MSIFDSTTLTWNGQKYHVPASQKLRLIARIEEELTLAELQDYARRKTAPTARLALAFGAALRFAGCEEVDDDEVFAQLLSGELSINTQVNVLLYMMLPKEGSVAAKKLSNGARQEVTAGKEEPIGKAS